MAAMTECLISICAAAAKHAILTNWKDNFPTALDAFAYFADCEMALRRTETETVIEPMRMAA